MHFFKNIGVQLVLCIGNFRPKLTIMLKYQIEINDNIWFLYCRETLIMKLVLAETNATRIKEMHLKVLELEYSENIFCLMSVFNELKFYLCTIESLLLDFMKPSLWPFGPQKQLLSSHSLRRVPKLYTTPRRLPCLFSLADCVIAL